MFAARGKRLVFVAAPTPAIRSPLLATVLQLLFYLSAAKACYTNEPTESILQCKHQFARSGQVSEFDIFAPPNAALCTVPPGADAPLPAATVLMTVEVL